MGCCVPLRRYPPLERGCRAGGSAAGLNERGSGTCFWEVEKNLDRQDGTMGTVDFLAAFTQSDIRRQQGVNQFRTSDLRDRVYEPSQTNNIYRTSCFIPGRQTRAQFRVHPQAGGSISAPSILSLLRPVTRLVPPRFHIDPLTETGAHRESHLCHGTSARPGTFAMANSSETSGARRPATDAATLPGNR